MRLSAETFTADFQRLVLAIHAQRELHGAELFDAFRMSFHDNFR